MCPKARKYDEKQTMKQVTYRVALHPPPVYQSREPPQTRIGASTTIKIQIALILKNIYISTTESESGEENETLYNKDRRQS
jgi:hypothetical protein